ncbi:U4/U5/U6 small nuclear ribonucleoprotein prp3 [Polyrhizophydium stewartii]|uniref:U4/U5/U6 small nuclear ribonucleoprotein prp3 n=1 Tax=Polyrhizophydium stewartii TaxID=2732419 RepID=A0ABR4N1Z5_9FUNG|nr:hypothetical protein HK105_000658 [Polyrhizophydium stewartii]
MNMKRALGDGDGDGDADADADAKRARTAAAPASMQSPEEIQRLREQARQKAAALAAQAQAALARIGVNPIRPAAGVLPVGANPIRPGGNPIRPGANPIRPGAAVSVLGNPVRPVSATGNPVRPPAPVPSGSATAVPGMPLSFVQPLAARQAPAQRPAASQLGNGAGLPSPAVADLGGDLSSKAKGGLKVEFHPLLMRDSVRPGMTGTRKTAALPVFSTVSANERAAQEIKLQQEQKMLQALQAKKELKIEREVSADFKDPSKNPYFDPSLKSGSAVAPKPRASRPIKFVQHGKYIEMAEKQRKEAMLEKLKKDIAEKIKTTGIEKEIELVSDRGMRTEPPPPVEWWDAKFVPEESYDSMPATGPFTHGDELITNLEQHPVPIQPPAEPGAPPPRPIMLTKKERKKLRRQRRLEDRKEKQEKIRLGLLPPEEAKLKLSNMMRALGDQVLLNPSLAEAKVREQMAARKQKHADLVASTKLTDEQRREKLRNKLKEDTSLMVQVAVFRINDLSHAQHRFKVDKNAQQYNLTGVAIVHPGLNLVVVEGGPKGIKAYRKLMLRRILWAKTSVGDEDDDEDDDDAAGASSGAPAGDGANRCVLVWEGEVQNRAFRVFRFKSLPTDSMVREYLEKMRVVHYWDAARNFIEDGC